MSFQDKKLEDLVNDQKETVEESNKSFIDRFFGLFKNVNEEDCEGSDCDPIKCPDCGENLEVVFGSFPLKVYCVWCDQEFLLRNLAGVEK